MQKIFAAPLYHQATLWGMICQSIDFREIQRYSDSLKILLQALQIYWAQHLLQVYILYKYIFLTKCIAILIGVGEGVAHS